MNIDKLTQAFATYFKEDEDIVRNIIVDNLDFADMGFDIDMEFTDLPEEYEEDLTDEELREEVDRIRQSSDWMQDDELVKQMEGMARQVFDGLSLDHQCKTLLDMVLSLCDEIDELKKKLNDRT